MQRQLPGRATGRRVKLHHDITLCFGGLVVYQSRLIAPFVNSLDDGQNEVRRTMDWPYALDAAIFGDSRFDEN